MCEHCREALKEILSVREAVWASWSCGDCERVTITKEAEDVSWADDEEEEEETNG